ncbi:hypothetical protein LCGC14_2921340, partial [marine sediment metagenome]
MSRPGPPPQPTKLRLLRGNPGKRRINKREPKPEPKIPACPEWLNDEAKAIWMETVTVLKEMRILTRCDRQALTVYCETYAQWKEAVQWLHENGQICAIRDEKGAVKCMQAWPQISIARNCLQTLRAYQQEFG